MSPDTLLGLVFLGRGGQRWQVIGTAPAFGVRIDAGDGLRFWLADRAFDSFIDKGILTEEAAATVAEPSGVLTEVGA